MKIKTPKRQTARHIKFCHFKFCFSAYNTEFNFQLFFAASRRPDSRPIYRSVISRLLSVTRLPFEFVLSVCHCRGKSVCRSNCLITGQSVVTLRLLGFVKRVVWRLETSRFYPQDLWTTTSFLSGSCSKVDIFGWRGPSDVDPLSVCNTSVSPCQVQYRKCMHRLNRALPLSTVDIKNVCTDSC